jgi:serine/threonine-protein kinase HipA
MVFATRNNTNKPYYIKHANIDLSESVENEWLCLKILAAFDLPVNQAKIIQFREVKTLVVERFDRRWTDKDRWLMRLPQEDLCQALGKPPGLKYESDGGPGIQDIMGVLLGSQDARNDRKKFIKSVFLFWVLGAIDGHAKNFSIRIEPQGRYQLTPLYDVISAYPLTAKKQLDWQELKMAMSLRGKNCHYLWNIIQVRHWFSMAEKCQFPKMMMQEIIDDVCDHMENVITQVTQTLPPHFPPFISDSIFSGMRHIKNRCLTAN